MNEKLKNFFCIIGSVITGFFTAIFTVLLHNRRTTNGTRKSIENAKRTNSESKTTVERIRDSVEQSDTINSESKTTVNELTDTNRKLEESVESNGNIFEEIRKQKLD